MNKMKKLGYFLQFKRKRILVYFRTSYKKAENQVNNHTSSEALNKTAKNSDLNQYAKKRRIFSFYLVFGLVSKLLASTLLLLYEYSFISLVTFAKCKFDRFDYHLLQAILVLFSLYDTFAIFTMQVVVFAIQRT